MYVRATVRWLSNIFFRYMGYMDSNGDAEGNYTLLARQEPAPGNFGLYPVGGFSYRHLSDNLPVSAYSTTNNSVLQLMWFSVREP